MKQRNATLPYAFVHIMLWALYGFLFSFANPYLTNKLHLSDTAAGVTLGIATGIAFLLQPILTSVIDRTNLNVRRVSIFCALFTAVCACATGLPLGERVTMLLFAASCVGLQVIPSFANALGMEGIRGGQKINFGLSRGCGSVSFAAASKIAPVFIARFGMDAVAVSGAACAALLAVAVALFPKGERLCARREETPSSAREFFRENPRFIGLMTGVILLYIGHNALTNCMYRIAESKLSAGSSEAVITDVQGTALMISAVVELPMMFLFTLIVRKVRCDLCLILSTVFMTVRLILSLLVSSTAGLYAAQFTQIFGYALFAVASVYYVGTVISRRNVVKGQTYLGSSNTMGCLLAYVLCGSLIDMIGVNKMLIVSIVLSAIGLLCTVLCTERVKQTVGA